CVSKWAAEELLRRAAFRVFASGLRPLSGLLLALVRRRIAHPKGLGPRRFSKWDYSRDLRSAKWGSMINLRSLSALSLGWPFSKLPARPGFAGDGCCGA